MYKLEPEFHVTNNGRIFENYADHNEAYERSTPISITPRETVTFSRALHLMRYGGKKMRHESWGEDSYSYIKNGDFKVFDGHTEEAHPTLASFEIMGSWVEVK
jgi:hypothetical protein